ncbi:MAG: ABC transporter ATP-binding protein [Oscillospiraceae bacterium]|nr:ABC transporter ATP-binding protein [Oscillospiraceae bacterium]
MVEVSHLTKKYGDFTAVSDLSFTIEDGLIYGFLGPNGAGKSTTMNIMTGCLSATEGEVIIEGHDIFEEAKEAKKCIGYLPEIPPLYPDLTPVEYLEFVARAKGVPANELDEQIENVMEETGITVYANRLIKNLSKGYKQRVGIAQAIIGRPSLIILDEPTVGLDPKQIIEIRNLIKSLGRKHTVVLSSHILSEVQAICDRVMIISRGKLVAFDAPENLESLMLGEAAIEVKANCGKDVIEPVIQKMDFVTEYDLSEDEGVCTAIVRIGENDRQKMQAEMFRIFGENAVPVFQMTPVKASLEDVFIELTHGSSEPDPEPEDEEVPQEDAEE